jgi:hypothetical protein
MSDGVVLNSGSGGETAATDDCGASGHAQIVKLAISTDGSATPIPADAANGIDVDVTRVGGTVTVDGSGVTQPVSDAGGSLTVDNAALSVTGGGAEASALRVTIADDSTGVVSVDDGGSSLTVDGTVAATQSGTWNVTNVSGTVSLPTGAATAAKQPALGTAGTPSADVISVQGVSGGTVLPVSDGGASLTVDGTVAATQSGTWSARIQDGSGNALTSKTAGAEQAISVAIVDGSGNQVTSFGGSGGTSATDDAAFTPASGSGTPIMGFADETSPDAVDEGDVGVVRMTLQRALHVNLRDASGAELSVGGGTQYTEDAAAAANPVGTALNLIRADVLAGVTSADGDNVAARGTDNGELYVKHVDAIPATQSGTWNVTNISGTVSLPTGAATAAKQPALGTAGTASADVITVQGIASMTALTVDGSGVTQPISAASLPLPTGAATSANQSTGNTALAAIQTSVELLDDAIKSDDAAFTPATTKVLMAGFEFDDSSPDSVDEGDAGAARMSANRNVYTQIRDAAGNERGVNVNASNQLSVSVDNTVTVGSHAVTNAGTFATQVDGSALTALQLIDDPVFADDAAFTPGTSKVTVSGYIADESSTDSVDEGDAGAARMTLDRRQITVPQPHSAGGLSIFRSLDLDETEEDVKTSAGCVYGCWVTNTATSTRWLKFFNATAANVTVGSTTPVITIGIPGNSSDDISANFGPGGMGIQFDTAISVAATTGVADADTGAPGANDVVINVFYR